MSELSIWLWETQARWNHGANGIWNSLITRARYYTFQCKTYQQKPILHNNKQTNNKGHKTVRCQFVHGHESPKTTTMNNILISTNMNELLKRWLQDRAFIEQSREHLITVYSAQLNKMFTCNSRTGLIFYRRLLWHSKASINGHFFLLLPFFI